MLLAFLAWLPSAVLAAELAPSDFERQRILWSDFQSHMEGMHEHQPGDRGICLTGLVQRLRQDWHVMTVEQRSEITAALAPSRQDLFERQPAGPPPPTPATDTCWQSTKDNRIDTQHFSVQWDDGIIDEEDAQKFVIADDIGIIGDPHAFRVARPAGGDDVVFRRRRAPAPAPPRENTSPA